MDMLRVYDQPDLDSFPSGLWGIREPPSERYGERRSNGWSLFTSLARAVTPGTLDISTPPALDGDQQLDLIIVPGERVPSASRTVAEADLHLLRRRL